MFKIGDKVKVTPHYDIEKPSFKGFIVKVILSSEYCYGVRRPNNVIDYFCESELERVT